MAKNKKTTIPAGMPSEIAEKQGLSTNDITEGKDTGSWFMNENGEVDNSRTTKEMVHDFNEAKGYDQPEPLEGASGLIARGNQGDNAIANPDAPDTADITKKHNEELAQLQNAIGDTDVATGIIPNEPLVTEEAKVEEESDGDGKKPDGGDKGDGSEDTTLPKAPEEGNLDFSEYINNFYGPKNGADYLKSLWSQGAGGKAAAIGNVLGNLLGATGKGLAGKDYTSDWQTYKDNYTKEMAERNQKAFDQNMDISKQLRTNDVARNEMLKTLENYQKIGGNLTPEKFENIRKALTATGKGSQIDYYLAGALGELSSDPAFMEAAKEAGGNAVELLGNLAQFSGNTIRPLNWFFGQAGNTMNNMFGGK
jgi:flagellar hook-associated protein FlgK